MELTLIGSGRELCIARAQPESTRLIRQKPAEVYERGKGEKAIGLREWLPLHEAWIQKETEQRMPCEKVWEYAHWKGLKAPKRIPPMPKIKLPPIQPSK